MSILKETYYFIFLHNPTTNIKGYVGQNEKGEILIFAIFVADVTTFTSYADAQKFVTEHGLDKKPGVKWYIKDGDDLIREGVNTDITVPLFCVENQAGWKLFWSVAKKTHYWDNKEFGYVVVHQEWIDYWIPRLNKKWPLMEIKTIPMKSGKMVSQESGFER